MSALDLALQLIDKGIAPVPVAFLGKKPTDPRNGEPLTGWTSLRITRETAAEWFSGKPQNVGVILGEPSNWLVDVDLDCPEAIELAPHFLPLTVTFGRESAPRSHWGYRSVACTTKKYKDPTRETGGGEKDMIVEIRSTGSQTVFPGSVHVSGEPIEWTDTSVKIAEVDPLDLERAVSDLAVASILKRHTPPEGLPALSSALLGLGWDRIKVEAVCGPLGAAVPVGDFATLGPHLNNKGRTALHKALSWLGQPKELAKCKATRNIDAEDEPPWLRCKSQQEREDAAAHYLKDVPYEGTGDGSSQLVRKAAEICRGFACGERGGVRVLKGAKFAKTHTDAKIERVCKDVMDPGKGPSDRAPWGCKYDEYQQTRLDARAGVPATGTESTAPRITAADRALRIGGKATRIKTGIPTLDACTRGGLLLRRVAVFGGAPGAGKTALLVRLAFSFLAQGITVGILAADEDAEGLLVRLGQLSGLSREALEDGDPKARAALAAWCKSVPLLLADGDEDDGAIEDVSRDLRNTAAGNPSVLITDSVQTARTVGAVPRDSDLRLKTNHTMHALKRAAKVDGHLVLASSELARGAYRNQDQAENINLLAAFKESGDIEYGTALAAALISRQGTSELVDMVVCKNRLGPKTTLMLKLDHTRADVTEATTTDMKTTDPAYWIKVEIRNVVEKSAGVAISKSQIAERVGGKRQTVWKAIDAMLATHELHQDKQGHIRFPLPGDPGYEAHAARQATEGA